jgi:hypothetical protein
LIGVLCTELAEGMELNKACKNWNKRVDPVNYQKAVAPITKRQIEEAKKFVQEKGYEESFNRRLATIDDIKASEIKHINVGNGSIPTVSIFDNVKPSKPTRHKRSELDNVEEISIDKFFSDILPNATSVEVYLENKHKSNFVNLTTALSEDSKPMFNWDNNYSWTYANNLTGVSQIKEAIKGRGGKVEGVLNIRLAFPGTTDDYDLHLYEPDDFHVYYSNVRKKSPSGGMLDLDANGVDGRQPPEKRVENIIYTDLNKMKEGTYKVSVHNYSRNGFRSPFTMEIEFDNTVTVLTYQNASHSKIEVATITLKDGKFSLNVSKQMTVISSDTIQQTVYGLDTNSFHEVELICLSPNHWGDNSFGNKHYMFMLKGAMAEQPLRSFHNENLNAELKKHRKVMEVLANTTQLEPKGKQLAGLGFNSTVKNDLIVKVKGSHNRTLKVKI